jgi:OOP family OmpA-OmpF porin
MPTTYTTSRFLLIAFSAIVLPATVGYAAGDCAWVRDTSGKPVRDSAGLCVKSGNWKPGAPVPPECIFVSRGPKVLFDFDKAEIKAEQRRELDSFASGLKSGKSYEKIVITGHTDSVGSDDYNQRLSEKRANAVKGHLAAQGLDGGKIEARGQGESKPAAQNNTEAGRAQNRRTEIEVHSSGH